MLFNKLALLGSFPNSRHIIFRLLPIFSTSLLKGQQFKPIAQLNNKILYQQRMTFRPIYNFSITSKKSPQNLGKKTYRILKSQMKTGQNGQKYFLLYDGQKQQTSFQILSGLFLLLFGLSVAKLYYTESGQRKDDYIILVIVVGSFFVYQKRIMNTLKKVRLNPKGDKLFITTFNGLAKGQTTVQAPVEIMTGIWRATRFGGYNLKGGNKTAGLKQMKFWFSNSYIIDRPTFQYVSQGKIPKIVDQYQTM